MQDHMPFASGTFTQDAEQQPCSKELYKAPFIEFYIARKVLNLYKAA